MTIVPPCKSLILRHCPADKADWRSGRGRRYRAAPIAARGASAGLTRVLLLERDQVRAGQRWGFWLQRLVPQVAIALIQDLIKTNRRFVVGGGRGRIHRDDDGVIAQRRS